MKTGFNLFVATAALTLLAGCGDSDNGPKVQTLADSDTGPIIASVAGQPVLREGEFRKRLDQMMQAYPQLRGMSAEEALPPQVQRRVAEQLASQSVIEKWGEKEGIASNPEFQQMLAEAHKEMNRLLVVQYFEKQVLGGVEVSSKDVREEYNTNKERYVKTPGGTKAVGAKFASADVANAFLAKVKDKSGELQALAGKEKGATFRDFGSVTDQSFNVPEKVRAAVNGASSFPSVQVVGDGQSFWVVAASEKVQAEHLAFDEIKDQLEQMLRSQRFQEAVASRMDELKGEFPIELNEDMFAVPEAAQASTPSEAVAA